MKSIEALSEFIGQNTTRAKFAEAVGCSEGHLSLLLAGKRRPSLDLANRIQRHTNEAVPMSGWDKASAC
jgi:transcriptional regulator with XRE-family HTH domain